MGLFRGLARDPRVRLSGFVALFPFLLASLVLVALGVPAWDDSATLGIGTGVAYLASGGLALQLAHRDWGVRQRRLFWVAVAALCVLLALTEFSGDLVDRIESQWSASDYDDLVLWLLTPIGLYFASTEARAPRLSVTLLAWGFAFQSVSNLIDLFEPEIATLSGHGLRAAEIATAFSEFLFIEIYLLGLVTLILSLLLDPASIYARALAQSTGPTETVRAAYRAVTLMRFRAGKPPRLKQSALTVASWPLVRVLAGIAPTRRNWRVVRARTGKGWLQQLREQGEVATRHAIAPPWYYAFELYLDDRRAVAGDFLNRFETKGTSYKMLRAGGGALIRDKQRFAEHCLSHGVRAAAAEMTLRRGAIVADRTGVGRLPAHDLFIKPIKGKGGRGAERWDHLPDGRYRDPAGEELDEAMLRARLLERSREVALLVQRRLKNHSAIADLCNDALATVRVVSCRDEDGRPRVVNAVLRMARGRNHLVDNFHAGGVAAEVDVETGALGRATDLGFDQSTGWLDRHPDSGAAIAGRILPLWPETRAFVERAHEVLPQRILVGWDIAILEDGPCVIEANSAPDLDIVQRTMAAPLGRARLGEMIAHHIRERLRKLAGTG